MEVHVNSASVRSNDATGGEQAALRDDWDPLNMTCTEASLPHLSLHGHSSESSGEHVARPGAIPPSADTILRDTPRFLNPSNACYQNALINGLLAVHMHTGISFGGIQCLLGSRQHIQLSLHDWFRPFLQHWAEPERQHDIAEFAQHLLPQLTTSVANWEGRIMIGGITEHVYQSMNA